MAIRPEIALEAGKVPQFDLASSMGNIMKLGQLALQPQMMMQQLEAAKIAQQQAQINLEREKRDELARKRSSDIANQFTTFDKSGKKNVDHRQIAETLAYEGFDPVVVSSHLTRALVNEAPMLKTDTDKIEAVRKNRRVLDNLIRKQTDPAVAQEIFKSYFERDVNLADENLVAAEYESAYPDPTNLIEQAKANFKTTVETQAEQQALDIAAKQEERAAALSYASPEARDPNSDESKKAREVMASAGFEVPANISKFELHKNPILSKQYESLVPGEGARISAAEKLTGIESALQTINNGIEVAERIRKQAIPTMGGSFVKNRINELIKQYPDLGILNDAIAVHNQQFPNSKLSPKTDSYEKIISTLQNLKSNLTGQSKKQKGIAVESTLPRALGVENTAKAEPKAEEEMVEIVRNKTKIVKRVPKSLADEMVRGGNYKRLKK